VAERLGKVADEAPLRRLILLGEQPDVVAQAEQPLEDIINSAASSSRDP